jgi:hypothetical protein
MLQFLNNQIVYIYDAVNSVYDYDVIAVCIGDYRLINLEVRY